MSNFQYPPSSLQVRLSGPWLTPLLILALTAAPAVAQTVSDVVSICTQGSNCTTLAKSSTGPVSASGTLFGGTATGSADGTGGILHASVSYDLSAPAPTAGQVNANAQFFDQVTINAPGLGPPAIWCSDSQRPEPLREQQVLLWLPSSTVLEPLEIIASPRRYWEF